MTKLEKGLLFLILSAISGLKISPIWGCAGCAPQSERVHGSMAWVGKEYTGGMQEVAHGGEGMQGCGMGWERYVGICEWTVWCKWFAGEDTYLNNL